MGGKSSPDMQGAAIAQGEANREVVRDQTFANRPDQYTPWGSTSWNPYQTTDPATGEATTAWEQKQSLTPELQDILNKQIAIQGGRSDIAGTLTGRLGAEFGTPMDWRGLTPMGEVPTSQFTIPEPDMQDPYQTRQKAEYAMYNSFNSRAAPAQAQERQALEIKMRNQGLGPEDEAWQAQVSSLGLKQNDQNNQGIWQSVGEGRSESGQMFGQGLQANQNAFGQASQANQQNYQQAMQGSAYANQLRQQQLTESMQKRGYSLNEINALLSGQQVGTPQMPNFSQAAAAQPAPIYQAAADQASISAASSPWNALIGAGGTALGGAFTGGYI
jgi:hypothetical protein